jgi:VWFA-related protein
MKHSGLPQISRLVFLTLFLFGRPVSPGQQLSPLHAKTISLTVRVIDDRGRAVTNLRREQFSILEKNVELEVSDFDSRDEPTSVALLFDTSASVESFRRAAVEAASQFIQSSNKSNDYSIITFNEEVQVLCDLGCGENDLKKAFSEIVRQKPRSLTAFYDACAFAVTKLESSKYSNRVILLFGDGLDNASKVSFKKLREAVSKCSSSIYAIALGETSNVGGALGKEVPDVLEELTSLSGGKVYFPRDLQRNEKELRDITDQISEELSHEYTLSFKPALAAPNNKWHSIKVKITPPKNDQKTKLPHLNLRYRPGYYIR